jgi:hypothetical protein
MLLLLSFPRPFRRLIQPILLVIAVSATNSVWANDIPNYPVEEWCEKVSRAGGSKSEMIYSGCINQEQSAYDTLKRSWAALPRQTQEWCDKVAKSTGGGSYMILNGCVDQEISAGKENTTRRFQR